MKCDVMKKSLLHGEHVFFVSYIDKLGSMTCVVLLSSLSTDHLPSLQLFLKFVRTVSCKPANKRDLEIP